MNDAVDYIIVDRIAGEIAVCEKQGREMTEISLAELPVGVKEGDCLRRQGGSYIIDMAETLNRRAKNQVLLRQLLGRDSAEK